MYFCYALLLVVLVVRRAAAGSSGVGDGRYYLLYDVNPGEGFNLRRDVYMRVARLAHALNQHALDVTLVLPPWTSTLYHWRRDTADEQTFIPWRTFFNVPSLHDYTPVIEFSDFCDNVQQCHIDRLFYLQNFADAFKDGVKWEEKTAEEECHHQGVLEKYASSSGGVSLFGYDGVSIGNTSCLSAQGSAISIMKSFLLRQFASPIVSAVMLDRAEVLLHDDYGMTEYWRVRRSMRFARHLTHAGNQFRATRLNSTDGTDRTAPLDDWREQESRHGDALGGAYLGVHWRRRDYKHAHGDEIPSIAGAATQINALLLKHDLHVVFLATDAEQSEVVKLKSELSAGAKLHQFIPANTEYLPGEVAVIDQWIASRARYFIGSYVSTFSFRIQEERELAWFPPRTTFNRLCADRQIHSGCEQPANWLLVYSDREYWDRLTKTPSHDTTTTTTSSGRGKHTEL